MEVNEIAAGTASAASAQTSHAVKTTEMAKNQIEKTGEQVMQLLEVTAPGQLRTDPLSPLGSILDVKA